MKALIISEEKEFIDKFDDLFSQKGFDTIIYKWLLKAIDNIEEIRPNCIILNSSEYPRHWKTLVQFVKSGIGGDEIAIFLYEPNPLSSKDKNKAIALGITDFITSFDKDEISKLNESIDNFFDLKNHPIEKLYKNTTAIIDEKKDVEKKQQLISVSNITVESSENVSGTGDFIFTHPENGKFICGKFFDKNNNKITAKIDTKEKSILKINDEIKNFTYSYDDKYESVQAKVCDFISVNNDNFIIFQLN
ncbi:MAG: hypothetical protein PT936_06985 [Treponema sp.]|nr:hypothetical protein [Treponema sp.]